MYSTYLFWLTAVALLSPAVAQGILNSVDNEDGNGDSNASATTRNISSKGMIILCTIVAVVVLIGVLFTAAFITAKKRRLRARQTLSFTDSTDGSLGVRAPTGRGQDIPTGPKRGQMQPDLEKNAGVDQDRSHRDSDTRQRGWGSYFSFGRT
ncbi:hypothetical protein BO78DRAFT_463672 [Aspergillus sclerotiicarbonarius CBS 121057]|uniref:Mid2 domain-containing protein n=1 Tax=Aspergillus sclerotiicarbonarius (strain CBS 121057 / IBT 28362) TaxID=1448318 RepID=A0A319E418_ASPSB|nr:hypothetical protein BO78DRAFT_463672 [Aspergillus sclerotiicarbonarius CBS 121057]